MNFLVLENCINILKLEKQDPNVGNTFDIPIKSGKTTDIPMSFQQNVKITHCWKSIEKYQGW